MLQDLSLLKPELFMLIMCNIILLADVFAGKSMKNIAYYLSQITLIGTFYFILQLVQANISAVAFNMVAIDPAIGLMKLAMFAVVFFGLIYSNYYINQKQIMRGEYYSLCMFSLLGMMVLVSATNLITVYLGLELVSLPLYALIAIVRSDQHAVEASMKYFIMGAIATGMLLYGMSIIYGISGSLDLTTIASQITALENTKFALAIFAMVFIVAGIAFKFGAVPFHMWLPDVYQGAPSSVAMFVATAPKIAALGMALRLLDGALPDLWPAWQEALMILAVLSLFIGNLVAIAQTNIKRMLAYSAIAHIGFLFLGLMNGPEVGFANVAFYTFIYVVMTLGAFGIITCLSERGKDIENITDLKGLQETHPWMAFLMLVFMFSLAGVPPTAGFYAKFLIINALVEANFVVLAVIAVIFSIIGAFYYLRVIKNIYFDEADGTPIKAKVPLGPQLAISINGITILALGIFPGLALNWIIALF